MEINVKKLVKVAGAACVATGVVAVSALVASSAAVGVIAEGFQSARNALKNIWNDSKQDEATVEDLKAAESAQEHQ